MVDRHFPLDALLERDERLGGDNAGDGLQLVVEQIHELLIVARIGFDEHGIGACGEVALHDFGDVDEPLDNVFVHRSALQIQSHVGAGAVSQALGIDVESASEDHTVASLKGIRAFFERIERIFLSKLSILSICIGNYIMYNLFPISKSR